MFLSVTDMRRDACANTWLHHQSRGPDNGDPIAHLAGIRRAIHEVDPTQAVSSVRTIEQDVANVFATTVRGIAAAVALRGIVSTLVFGVTPGDPIRWPLLRFQGWRVRRSRFPRAAHPGSNRWARCAASEALSGLARVSDRPGRGRPRELNCASGRSPPGSRWARGFANG